MKRVLVSFVLIAALAACGKKDDKKGAGGGSAPSPGAKASADDCDKLGAKTSVQSMENTPPGATDDQRAKLKALSDEAGKAIAKHCKDDGWTSEAVVCGLRSKNPQVECDDKLTADQKQKMTTEVQAIFAKAMTAAPPPTPPAPSLTLPPPAGEAPPAPTTP